METLQAIAPLKSFGKERHGLSLWRNAYQEAVNSDVRSSRLSLALKVVSQAIVNAELLMILSAGVGFVINQRLTVGMLMAFLAYRQQLVTKALSFVESVIEYQLLSTQTARLSDIVLQEPEANQQGYYPNANLKASLAVRSLSFRYQASEQAVFEGLNLDVQEGEKVAIVGPSGSGKTTLLKIMMGLMPASSGDVLMDGFSIRALGLRQYRSKIASVMQDDRLMSGSILDNITFFDEEPDLEQVHAVCKIARIHDSIQNLPMSYQTLLGDTGTGLSGGQKQRILLARALYKKPKILFLDEATSHLDQDNEREIAVALKALPMTQIIVAHRQTTIDSADRIIRLLGKSQKSD